MRCWAFSGLLNGYLWFGAGLRGEALVRFPILSLLIVITTVIGGSFERLGAAPWHDKILRHISGAQLKQGCFSEVPRLPTVYLLGVDAADDLLDRRSKRKLMTDVHTFLSRQSD